MHIFLDKCVSCNAICMWMQPYLFTLAAAETAPAAGRLVRHDTQTCKQCYETTMFMNTKMLQKSRLYAVGDDFHQQVQSLIGRLFLCKSFRKYVRALNVRICGSCLYCIYLHWLYV